ncbi:Ig-like domain-containing protein [Vagococcus luciliae]|uniref:Ig-like domain-containing protein n=1 Tax=Vagococcus luciliae TaxID=2920380 RepID=UPI00214E23CF|nr:Ig-like domain-containing protein [Vagococcus luciliae]
MLPNTDFETLENWIHRNRNGSGPYSDVRKFKEADQDGFYRGIDEKNKEMNVGYRPNKDGSISIKHYNTSNIYTYSLMSLSSPLVEGNRYKMIFSTNYPTSNKNVKVKFRIAEESKVLDTKYGGFKIKVDGKGVSYTDDWITPKNGLHELEFTSKTNESVYIEIRTNAASSGTIDFSNISFVDITPPGNPILNPIEVNDTKITGKVSQSDMEQGGRTVLAGDIVNILKIESDGTETLLGTTTVNENSEWSYSLENPAKSNQVYKVYITNPNSKIDSESVTKQVPFSADSHKPELNQPTEGDESITGKGQPGDKIVITDKDGNVIGEGNVGEDGKFEITPTRPLVPGETITATPNTDGKEGTPSDTTVAEKPFDKDSHKPELNQPTEGDQVVTGTGTPGDDIKLTDKDGNVIGEGNVGEDGKFEITPTRPLVPGETITATPNTDGKEGTPSDTTVAEKPFDQDAHKSEVNQPTEGDESITGKGQPGDKIVITDKDGNVIGEGEVGEDGNFNIKPERPLVPGETITATPNTDGKEGTPSDTTVAEKPFDQDAHKPEVNQPTEGDESITGKGQPGDKIVITDKDGNVIGEGEVGEDGNFNIKPERPLVPGETITATPSTDGKEGTPSDTRVAEKPFDQDAHKPEINQPTEGDESITGKGQPGDKIVITDKDGNVIGEGEVGEDGKFEITPTRPLVPNEVITATPSTDGKEGTPSDTRVAEKPFDQDAHKPEVNQPTEGDESITGKGQPGDKIVITDKDGNVIGEGTVDKDGNFNIKPERPLVPNEVITATPSTDGKEGTPSDTRVAEKPFDQDAHKPEVNQPTEGDESITGKGQPGDKIVITDKDGNVIGEGEVGEDGNFNIKPERPLVPNEVITATPSTDGKEGTPSDTRVAEKPFDQDAHKPEVNQPTEGDESITGKGQPGDKIVITDKDGNVIGEGEVGEDGNFNIKPERPLVPNEVITATPSTDGKEGTPSDTTVAEKPFDQDAHKPEVNQPTEGDESITGKGQPGDKIVITDKDGNVIGEGEVGEDGNFNIKPERPLVPNEVITATPSTDGKEGTPSDTTVAEKPFDQDAHKPEVNQPTEGDESITGKGQPGDKIVITDKDGNVIGEGEVGEDGNFNIKPERPLVPNEVITATPSTDGKEGTPSDTTVAEKPFDQDAHKPEVNQPTEGDESITGKGQPGDKIVITDKDGNVIGEGEVGEDGNFNIKPERPLVPNEVITATPSTDGKEGTPSDTTVAEKPFDQDAHKPEVNQPTEGDESITGKGQPGDKIVITDKDGNVIGEGEVGEDGNFNIKPERPLVPNEVITATPSTDGKEGTPSDTTVAEKPFDQDAHKPEVNQPTEGDESITGKGQPGDKIVITDKDGNVIGEGEVGEDGKFEITPTRPLVPNEVITATPSTDGKEGTPSDTRVAEKPFDQDAHKPEVNQPTEGDESITGKGQPGDKIVITDKDGNVIGEGEVGEDGNFNIKPERPLVPNEVITATPSTDGKEGTPSDTTVAEKPFDQDAHKPEVNQPTEGDESITGKGQPGDKIVITDKDGNVIGEGEVGEDGNFNIKPERPLVPNEVITATPSTDGKEGTLSDTTVAEKPFDQDAHKPEVNQPTEGDESITGKGQPGDKIVITDKDGNVIGEGEVGEDGKFEITPTRPLVPNEVITATPSTDGKEGTPSDTTVAEKPFDQDAHKPEVNQPTEGDESITGKGQPGDKIVITDKDGNVIGEGEVGEDGKFEITPTRPLVPNEVITATPSTDGKEGTPSDTRVAEKPFDQDAHKPEVNQPTEGDESITGKGQPGDKIVITDKDGNVIGEGKVGEDGKFEITPTRPLVPGELLIVTPYTNGKGGTSTSTVVKKFDKVTPTQRGNGNSNINKDTFIRKDIIPSIKNTSKKQTLPQTGSGTSSGLMSLGTILSSLSGLFIFRRNRK